MNHPTTQFSRTGRQREGDGLPHFRPLELRRLQCYALLMALDVVVLFCGFGLVGSIYGARFEADFGIQLAQMLTPIFVAVAMVNGTYSIESLRYWNEGASRAISAMLIAALVVVFVAFSLRSSTELSRGIIFAGSLFTAFALYASKALMRHIVRALCGESCYNLLLIIDDAPPVALPLATCVDAQLHGLHPNVNDPAALHRIAMLLNNADRVVVNAAAARRVAWAMVLKGANVEGEVIEPMIQRMGAHGARIAGDIGLLHVSIGPLGLRARLIKRLYDLAFSLLAIAFLSPVLIGAAVAILVTEGTPVLFNQRRVGRGNRFFKMYKFRSMRAERSDCDGNVSASRDDDRITRVGRFLRATSIDELPQLFNVLRGQMSIVGPRPHATGSTAANKLFWEIDDRYWLRHACKPGLTGLAQVRGLRGATLRESDLLARVDADLEYLRDWSLWKDLVITFRTFAVLAHKNAF